MHIDVQLQLVTLHGKTADLRIMYETLSVSCVRWKLACAGLFETFNNGLQQTCKWYIRM